MILNHEKRVNIFAREVSIKTFHEKYFLEVQMR